MHEWRIKVNPRCDCGAEAQTMHHIVSECENRMFIGTLKDLRAATDEAVEQWLDKLNAWTFNNNDESTN